MTSSKSSTTNALTKLWTCSARPRSISLRLALIRACPISTIPFTTRSSSLPGAAASVYAVQIANQQDAEQQLGINRGSAHLAVTLLQPLATQRLSAQWALAAYRR